MCSKRPKERSHLSLEKKEGRSESLKEWRSCWRRRKERQKKATEMKMSGKEEAEQEKKEN